MGKKSYLHPEAKVFLVKPSAPIASSGNLTDYSDNELIYYEELDY